MAPSVPVLVVDDDAETRATIVDVLESEGYAVRTAADGAEALASVAAAPPCAVLLDMRMPGMDGRDFAAALRARGVRVPIVAMTAANDARIWADAVAADACLPKPFALDDLLATVARFCAA